MSQLANVPSLETVGIDGCRGGWVWVGRQGDDCRAGVVHRLEQLRPVLEQSRLSLIDMPIGLPDGGSAERQCDREARALLGRPRASSVFRPPCRLALAAADEGYRKVCEINRGATGVGLSRQTFNIVPKIRELDELLRRHSGLPARVRESHPELCLWRMNGERPMRFSKRCLAGRRERRALLLAQAPELDRAVDWLSTRFLRRELSIDDAVDAAVLAFAAQQIVSLGAADSFPRHAPADNHGLPMAMLLPPASSLIP